MAAKLVLVLGLLLVIVLAATYAVFRYFALRAEQRHEKEMLREQRDAELLTDTDPIDRELEREKER